MFEEIIQRVRRTVGRLESEQRALLDKVQKEQRDALTAEEREQFDSLAEQIEEAEQRIADLQADDERLARANAASARIGAFTAGEQRGNSVHVGHEPLTYRRDDPNRSYVADLVRGHFLGNEEARQRLIRHAEEVAKAPEFAEVRALDRADGSGGFFVPPAWLMGQWIELARAGRPTADLIRSQPLPPGTDSINIPKVASGTATAVQAADNDAVQETDLTDTSISIPVRTIAGAQTIAIQLLDQSPVNFDEVVFRDLLADYAVKTDLQVLSGTGTAGQVTGLLTQASTISVAVTGTDGVSVYKGIADAVQQVHTSRFLSPTVVVCHPRRWAWLTVQVDGNGRPLVVPRVRGNQPVNALGGFDELAAQGPVGDILGLPVVTDPNLPTNLGTGTNEDPILVMRVQDLLLWESSIRTRVLPEVSAQNLSVRLDVYGYLAFSAARYPQSTAVITGAGLVTPTFG